MGGITKGLIAYETALRACNGQISDIRNWLTIQDMVNINATAPAEPSQDD